MKLAVVTGQGDVKNVIKRGDHRACFDASVLKNTVIKVTFGDYFPLRRVALSSTFFDCLFIYDPENVFKYPALFYPSKET